MFSGMARSQFQVEKIQKAWVYTDEEFTWSHQNVRKFLQETGEACGEGHRIFESSSHLQIPSASLFLIHYV